ncbi:MAG: GFA family protein [Lysobacterales bacterium]
MLKGSCLCGAVTFEITGPHGPIEVCHCVQCRKWTGHFFANIEVPRDSVAVQGEEHISWYHSSDRVRRGFCATCGSTLFFDPLDKNTHNWIGIAMGALDTSTGLKIALHIFTAEKGDYYAIPEDEEQHQL